MCIRDRYYDWQVIAAAKAGFQATGVELNPWLVIYSKFAAVKEGVRTSASFHRSDLFKFPLKPYKNIVIFGVNEMVSVELSLHINLLLLNSNQMSSDHDFEWVGNSY